MQHEMNNAKRFRALLDQNENAVLLLSLPDGLIEDCNMAAEALLANEKHSLQQTPLADLLLTPVRYSLRSFFRKDRVQADSLLKSEIKRSDGVVIPVELTLRRGEYEGVEYTIAVLRDLSEESKAGKIQSVLYQITKATVETRKLPELLTLIHGALGTLIDTTNFFVALYDSNRNSYSFPYFIDQYETIDNKAWYNMESSLTDYVRRTAIPIRVDQPVQAKLIESGEAEVVGVDSPIWLGAPLKTASGVIGVVVVQSYHDTATYSPDDLELLSYVSDHIALAIERKQAEEELRTREERLNVTLEATQDCVFDWLIQSEDFLTNNRYYEMLGFDVDELPVTVSTWRELIHPDDLDEAIEVLNRHLDQESIFYENEYRLRHKDGSYRWILARGRCIDRNSEGKPTRMVGTMMDITDRKRTEQLKLQWEERVFHSQKMEAIGNLAGGVAHDFNNLLTAITGHLDMALLNLPDDHPVQRDIREVQRAADRATNLTKQLLTFSRKQSLESKVVNINNIIVDMDRMLRRLIREDIALVTDLQENLWNVRIDPSKFEQVIVNLVVNARDAMPKGGTLMIRTLNREFDAQQGELLGLEPDRYVEVSVADNGIGMSEDIRRQVFDPFFTTKEKGKGTGLGLSTVFGIVKQSRGTIELNSQTGAGTEVILYLPMSAGEVEKTAERGGLGPFLAGRGETILVVEDDIAVREMILSTLERLGYKVLTETDGEAGYYRMQQHADQIRLVISDVVMPRMNGLEFAEKVWETRPDLKFIFISGYMNEETRLEKALKNGHGFLSKPFRSATLVEQIRLLLRNQDETTRSVPQE